MKFKDFSRPSKQKRNKNLQKCIIKIYVQLKEYIKSLLPNYLKIKGIFQGLHFVSYEYLFFYFFTVLYKSKYIESGLKLDPDKTESVNRVKKPFCELQ